ncbi:MAG: RNA polymerase sigma factor [Pseudomonadota bacterium]
MNDATLASAEAAEAAARGLLGDIATGNQRALETFYRDYHGAVYQFALRLVRNPADAAELVNESMLEVWKAANTFRGGSRVRTWLLSIVNHRAVDLLRRKRRHGGGVELDDDLVDEGVCPMPDVLAGAQNAQQVRACIDRLPERQRQVVHLTFFEQLAYPEIAQVLEVPAGTVKTRMMHAKSKLMHCLAGFFGRGVTP